MSSLSSIPNSHLLPVIDGKMLSTHMHSLTSHYENYKEFKFDKAYRDPTDRETIVSKSRAIKEIYVTRHDNQGYVTHSLIFQGEYCNRVA